MKLAIVQTRSKESIERFVKKKQTTAHFILLYFQVSL